MSALRFQWPTSKSFDRLVGALPLRASRERAFRDEAALHAASANGVATADGDETAAPEVVYDYTSFNLDIIDGALCMRIRRLTSSSQPLGGDDAEAKHGERDASAQSVLARELESLGLDTPPTTTAVPPKTQVAALPSAPTHSRSIQAVQQRTDG